MSIEPQEGVDQMDWIGLSSKMELPLDLELQEIEAIRKVGIASWIRELLAETASLVTNPTEITRLGVKHKVVIALYNIVKASIAGAVAGMAAHELGSEKEIAAAISGACVSTLTSATFWVLVANMGIFPAIKKALPSIAEKLSRRRSGD